MKLHEHFLNSDLDQASREYHCTRDLIVLIRKNLIDGNIEQAKQLSIELTRSLHELEKLSEKKTEQDKVNRLVEMMGAAGIHMQVLRGVIND